MALTEWGDRWATPDGPPITYRHSGYSGHVTFNLECELCGQAPSVSEVIAEKTEAMERGRERRLAASTATKQD